MLVVLSGQLVFPRLSTRSIVTCSRTFTRAFSTTFRVNMDVTYNDASGYLVKPSGQTVISPTHGIVIVQEWWGINEAMKIMARKFADNGLLALVPDLYHGRVAATPDEARHLMTGLDWPAAIKEIHAAASYLRNQGCGKVVVTGFCMGGALAGASAVLNADVFDAAAPFYGIPPATLCNLEDTKIPVQAHFGKLDNHTGFADPASADAYEEKLKKSGAPYEFHRYDAGHAFMNETRPEAYNKVAADMAFERLISFVKSQ